MPTTLDDLSTEIVLDIFEYLSCNDIVNGFWNLNRRFNSIVFNHQHFFNHLEITTKNSSLWEGVLSSCIEKMIIRGDDVNFSLNLFPNLKSLIICCELPMDLTKFYSIVTNEQFMQLNSFRVQRKIYNDGTIENVLLRRIFNQENSLNTFECFFPFSFDRLENVDHLQPNVNIRSLLLKLIDFTDVFLLLQYVPNLKYFKLTVNSFAKHQESNFSNIQLERFHLAFENIKNGSAMDEDDWIFLTNFLKRFSSSLISLSMNFNEIRLSERQDFRFNGIFLEQQLLRFMMKLKQFDFYVNLFDDPVDVENLLSTFRNQFWFDHHWSIGIDQNYLFSLPFHFDQLVCPRDLDRIHSSNPMINNCDPLTWNRVKLIIFGQLNFNLIQQIHVCMLNLVSIDISSLGYQFLNSMEQLKTNDTEITLEKVSSVHCRYELIDDRSQLLLHILPHVKRLILSFNSVSRINFNLDRLYSELSRSNPGNESTTTEKSCFPNIEEVEIKFSIKDENYFSTEVFHLLEQLFELIPNLNNLTFHLYHDNDFNENSKPCTNMSQIISLLSTNRNLENYSIKHSYNSIQFTSKKFQSFI